MTTQNDGRNDFDFLVGTWKVHHRMLTARLQGSTEWVEFEGETVLRKILNGIGNIDDNVIHMPSGPVHAISLRLFNPQSKEWSIFWSTDKTGALDIPMVGLDLMVSAADQPDYVFIEANERAGLANHEPQPTAERFVDLLFPYSQPVVS